MSLLDGLAQYLATAGLGTYQTSGTYAPEDVALTVEYLPDRPDRVVCLTGYGGATVPSGQHVDEPRVQVRVRGTTGPTWSRERAQAIHDELHGLAAIDLPDGTHLVLAVAQGAPGYMGRDDNARHEHVVNIACSITNLDRIGR